MKSPDLRLVGQRLRALRKERGLTQTQVARVCLVSRKSVIRWEAGHVLPPAQTIATLMVLFEANYRYLVGVHDKRYFISADMLDADIWNTWNRLSPRGRSALKEMAKFLLSEEGAVQPA